MGVRVQKKMSVANQIREVTLIPAARYNTSLLSNYSGTQTLHLSLGIFSQKVWSSEQPNNQNSFAVV